MDCARRTEKDGTWPTAWAASIRRRTLVWKLGRVKRPSQRFLGSRAIFQMRSAFSVCPELVPGLRESEPDHWDACHLPLERKRAVGRRVREEAAA